jgi:hypothetical protein
MHCILPNFTAGIDWGLLVFDICSATRRKSNLKNPSPRTFCAVRCLVCLIRLRRLFTASARCRPEPGRGTTTNSWAIFGGMNNHILDFLLWWTDLGGLIRAPPLKDILADLPTPRMITATLRARCGRAGCRCCCCSLLATSHASPWRGS